MSASSDEISFAAMMRSTSEFLQTAVAPEDVASGSNSIQKTHFAHLKATFASNKCDMPDGKAAIELLDASRCFSNEQKAELRATISANTTLAGSTTTTSSRRVD